MDELRGEIMAHLANALLALGSDKDQVAACYIQYAIDLIIADGPPGPEVPEIGTGDES